MTRYYYYRAMPYRDDIICELTRFHLGVGKQDGHAYCYHRSVRVAHIHTQHVIVCKWKDKDNICTGRFIRYTLYDFLMTQKTDKVATTLRCIPRVFQVYLTLPTLNSNLRRRLWRWIPWWGQPEAERKKSQNSKVLTELCDVSEANWISHPANDMQGCCWSSVAMLPASDLSYSL